MSAPVITIFVRHSADCKYHDDEFYKRCNCRKHLRWSFGGRQHRRQAGTRSWEEAERAKERLTAQLSDKPVPESAKVRQVQTIRSASERFIKEKQVQDLSPSALGKHKLDMDRFVTFCERRGVYTFEGVTRDLLTDYKATWGEFYGSSMSRHFGQKRLRMFLKFCYECGWLDRVPKMAPVKVDEPPTMPLTKAEYERLLEAVPLEFTNGTAARLRAIIQLMRWTGLAVRDASCIRTGDLMQSPDGMCRVTTARQKTGVDVSVPIPPEVAKEILAAANKEGEYLFMPDTTTEVNFSQMRSNDISRVFERAKIKSAGHMRSHRLRDTFAVDLLEKGVPLEEVSKLLGHESIATTEKSYAKWVKGRQERLDKLVMSTW